VNTLKNIFQLNWNRKLINYIGCVLFEIVGVMLAQASCVFDIAVFGEIGERSAMVCWCVFGISKS